MKGCARLACRLGCGLHHSDARVALLVPYLLIPSFSSAGPTGSGSSQPRFAPSYSFRPAWHAATRHPHRSTMHRAHHQTPSAAWAVCLAHARNTHEKFCDTQEDVRPPAVPTPVHSCPSHAGRRRRSHHCIIHSAPLGGAPQSCAPLGGAPQLRSATALRNCAPQPLRPPPRSGCGLSQLRPWALTGARGHRPPRR